ncbi:hypothetical protein SLEP1_g48799 [Rubroshorea leprosula]|uniref:Cullin family profile domain-containing protein n=1 Tax=Rubroshorea leprosula TaxID=152421 RepID=A0AAV5LVM2_9ROSI|nr:hypothetical protein SLEP1_g48799 [Rubroshorea leprosula]
MASKDPEDACNTVETDEETIALRKKRSRRVSFADREITSVHIFNRDDDYETPPDSTPRSSSEQEQQILGLFKDLPDSDDSDDGDHEDLLVGRKSFLRPIESPSPGGSSINGSATSNDEDNFFGPVSASFIQPGRLSDSGASDDHHEVTMDSTAFSMHFRSLVRSESGDLKTPTGVHLAFEEKTPSQIATPSDTGNIMVLTKAKKLMSQSPISVNKGSSGKDSNDMSLVGETLHKYDYGKLSTTLEALMAGSSKDFSFIPASDSINSKSLKRSEVSLSDDDRNMPVELQNHVDSEPCNIDKHGMSVDGVSVTCIEVDSANGGSINTLIDEMNHDFLSDQNDGPSADTFVACQIQTPIQLNRDRNNFSNFVNGTSMLNSEFLAVNNGTPPNNSVEVLQLGMFRQPESGNLPPTGDDLKENSPEVEGHDPIIHQVLDQRYTSPSAGYISSVSAKQEQILLDTRNSQRMALYVTPSPKQPSSFLSRDCIKQGGSISFLLKSIYKSKIVQPSPSVSVLNDRIDNIKLRLSGSVSSKSSRFISVTDQSGEGLWVQHVDVPFTNLEDQLSTVDLKQEQLKNMVSIDSDVIGTLKAISGLSQDELAMRDEGSGDKLTQNGSVMASPAKLAQSVNKGILDHSLMPKHLVDGAPFASENNFPLMEIKLDQGKDKRDADVSDKIVSSPVRRLDQKLSSPVEYHDSLLGNLSQQDQDDELVPSSRQDDCSIHAVAEERIPPSSTFIEANSLKDLTQVKRVDDRENYGLDHQNASEALRNFHSLPRDGIAHKLHSGSPEKNDEKATNITGSAEKFLEEGTDASCIYASPAANGRSTNEQAPQKSSSTRNPTQSPTAKESTWSLSRKDSHKMSESDNLQLFVAKSAQFPSSNSYLQGTDERYQGSHVLWDPNPEQDLEKSTKRKRTTEEIALGEADHTERTNEIQWTPKVHRVGENNLEFMLEYADGSNKGNENNRGGKWMNRTDLSLKLVADTSQLVSPFIAKLNMRVIDHLADMLVHQQKINVLQMLCSEIQSQTYDKFIDVRHMRVAETRTMLSRLFYEKVKLQLMHVKHERLLNRGQMLRTGVQEAQMLKLNCISDLSPHAEKNTQADNDKVTTMKHEVEAFKRKIKNLTNSLHNYYKLKGEPNSADTIILLNEQLKKRTCCRFVCQDMQLWRIDGLLNRNGHHVVVLNYHGFICQRLTLNAGPLSSISVSNNLNDIKIKRNFPNMDACTVFEFVFKPDTAKKYVNSRSLAQETQRTSLILSNLLDVLKEVQLAQIEISSLTQTSFQSSADQLDLQLTFIDFESGRKLMIDLDVTCLGSGVYPTEVLPSRLQASIAGAETSLCQPLSAVMKTAVDGLRVGYSRILRLCQCVSQVLQALSK